MTAAACGNVKATALLLEEAKKQNKYGQTAAMIAASSGYLEVLKLLKDEFGMKCNENRTALGYAVTQRKIECVRFLKDYEATILIEKDITCLVRSIMDRFFEATQELMEKEGDIYIK